jgi:apolipoprotein N-acyltransferase
MSKFEYGVKRAISEVLAGIITYAIFSAFLSSGLIPPGFVLLFHLLNALSTAAFVRAVPFWATAYILGWLFGLGLMCVSGLVSFLDFLVYLVPLAVLVARILK